MTGTAERPVDVSVIVVTYRSAAYIGACLAALEKALDGVDGEAIIVDNASGDDTVEVVRKAAPWARVVARDANDGFGGGCHAGAEVARGRRLLFLNPDAQVAADCVAALLDAAARHPRAGIVGGRTVDEAGVTDPRSWWGRPTLWSAFCFGAGLSTAFPGHRIFDPESPRPWSGDPREVREAPVVTGALLMIERGLWDRLGGFDRSIFMYGEDADLCLRAARAGYRPVVTAEAVYVHPGGMSSTSLRKLVMLFTGKATVARTHLPPVARTLAIGFFQAGVLLRAVLGRFLSAPGAGRQGRPAVPAQDWRGLWRARSQWRRGWA
ncbi:hypothetical protein HNP84_009678 [Thermocatellispora tengchongensis]|uniref:Glycosyltransferase 2-like domain-containing protein n=1 Tax=Thermocatellispora tengchongensis TaxID=1073253 RepID=A0A840PER6_9ACTN|nr:glycosyltransferase family 2 protein [Thermocatellispora tengchongensis]MBB5139914.1 hypothetical protein [Thermocatellispora tengchongensis]